MSQRCPHCGLFNPEEADRCDCGYDFASNTIKSSYLVAHLLKKHGGEARVIQESSRSKIRSGVVLLGVAVAIAAASYFAAGRVSLGGSIIVCGVLLLLRGLRQRRLRSLDSATRDELIRRS